MKSSSRAPDPDPNIGKAALLQAETGVEWLNFAKDAFAVSQDRQAELDALTKEVGELQLDFGNEQLAFSRQQRERYQNVFEPIEDEFIAEARQYGSEARQQEAAAEAKADVETAAAGARQQQRRAAAAVGIDPTSGRYAGIDRATGLNTALTSAGAQNNARRIQRDRGLALKADLVNMGRGVPAQSASAAATGLGAGTGAVGLHGNANSQYLASTGIMGQGFQGQMAGYAGQANTLNQQYSTQVAAWEAEQRMNAANAAGFGQAIGGIFGAVLSDKNAKENKKPVESGKALEAVRDMPVSEYDYKEGRGDGGHHVGPMAQDFSKATGIGDGKVIPIQDAIGVTMKAVQDLDKKVDRIASGLGDKKRKAA
ncbi:tail fiber domain-containing protein [Oricola sp.]|uniref:tail fiber domain-containing protein n=1 Tax=Oricola sp. TaxID=1979950 RepID=UPI003BAC2C96